AWGLPAGWWGAAWLGVAVVTLVFCEGVARREHADRALALELSTALALVLSGLAALLVVLLPLLPVDVIPVVAVLVLLVSGGLLIVTGWRREIELAEHAGLWLIAAAWSRLYVVAAGDSGTYGLWMSTLAAVALLVERLLLSAHGKKRKVLGELRDVVVRWPLADLVIGLSLLVFVWTGFTAMDVPATAPLVVIATLGVVIGVWVAAGLLYRLPPLVHIALWLAPLPYALALVQALPPFRTLTMLGVAWQALGVALILLGHLLPRYRPALLLPFFLAGYGITGVGLFFAAASPVTLVWALGVVVIVCLATSITVAAGQHPVWTTIIARLIPPDERPFAFLNVHNAFVFLTAWLAAIWLNLMLGYTTLTAPRQGVALVLLSTAWIVLGRLLPRLPGMVGWPVYAAGWFLWLTGLLQVFFAPAEAIITAILGLVLAGEALHRDRGIYWMPVFILQVLFSALQVAWMLDVSGYSFLLAVALGLSAAGLAYDNAGREALHPARLTAGMGALLAGGMWLVHLTPVTTLGLLLLAVVGLVRYRRWELLLGLLLLANLVPFTLELDSWRWLLISGGMQTGAGALLVRLHRPRRFRTFETALVHERDGASPFLWIGGVLLLAGLFAAWDTVGTVVELAQVVLVLAMLSTVYAAWLRIPRAPYLAVLLYGIALLLALIGITDLPLDEIGGWLAFGALMLALLALLCRLLSRVVVRTVRPFPQARWAVWWIRPLLHASYFLTLVSLLVIGVAQAYNPPVLLTGATLLLLAGSCALLFLAEGEPFWALGTLGLVWGAWALALAALGLSGWVWHSVPLGVLLLVLARVVTRVDSGMTELGGVAVLLIGAAADVRTHGLLSLATVSFGAQVVALAVYSVVAGRWVPLLCASAVIAGGIMLALLLVNVWLLPLVLGVLLLALAILLETRREQVAGWLRRF
ncbi:MAG: hypothetical protein GYB65_10400, partial [Chloroflexi bacterium]|nr:hypothetical protein [Chloroflexota bacterium]